MVEWILETIMLLQGVGLPSLNKMGGGADDGLRNRNGSPWYPRTADRVRRLCCRAAYFLDKRKRK